MRALRGMALAALLWRWWALAALLELALALPPALLWQQWLGGALGNRYAPGEFFANLGSSFRFDHRTQIAALQSNASLWLGLAALFAMLAGIFFAGGWVELAFDGQDRRVLERAGTGARRWFWRYVRVWLVTLVLLALWSWTLFDWPWQTVVLGWVMRLPESGGNRLENLTSEWTAVALQLVQAGVYALGVALCLACADYARLRMAQVNGRSALAGWIGSLWMVARNPWRTLAPMAAILAVEIGVVGAASWYARGKEAGIVAGEAQMRAVWMLVAVTVVLAFLRCWLRGARYLAGAEVLREHGT